MPILPTLLFLIPTNSESQSQSQPTLQWVACLVQWLLVHVCLIIQYKKARSKINYIHYLQQISPKHLEAKLFRISIGFQVAKAHS